MNIRRKILLLALLAVATPPAATAQSAPEEEDAYGSVRLYVGMWTMHLKNPGRGFQSNWLVAIGWRGLYGGTFVNSFGSRAFAAGIERPLTRSDDAFVEAGLGYRFGVVTGYDERLVSLASKLPVLPVLQLMGDMAVGRTGLELAWAMKVASMGPYMRLAD